MVSRVFRTVSSNICCRSADRKRTFTLFWEISSFGAFCLFYKHVLCVFYAILSLFISRWKCWICRVYHHWWYDFNCLQARKHLWCPCSCKILYYSLEPLWNETSSCAPLRTFLLMALMLGIVCHVPADARLGRFCTQSFPVVYEIQMSATLATE